MSTPAMASKCQNIYVLSINCKKRLRFPIQRHYLTVTPQLFSGSGVEFSAKCIKFAIARLIATLFYD